MVETQAQRNVSLFFFPHRALPASMLSSFSFYLLHFFGQIDRTVPYHSVQIHPLCLYWMKFVCQTASRVNMTRT